METGRLVATILLELSFDSTIRERLATQELAGSLPPQSLKTDHLVSLFKSPLFCVCTPVNFIQGLSHERLCTFIVHAVAGHEYESMFPTKITFMKHHNLSKIWCFCTWKGCVVNFTRLLSMLVPPFTNFVSFHLMLFVAEDTLSKFPFAKPKGKVLLL